MPAPATPDLYTLSLHDALPISARQAGADAFDAGLHRRSGAGARRRDRRADGAGFSPPALSDQPGGNRRISTEGRAAGPVCRCDRRSEEHTSELQSHSDLVCRLLPPQISTLFPYTTLFRSRLVKPEQMHLTLVFIGEVAQERGAAIAALMEPDFPLPPFRISLGGIGAFPPRGAPRVLYVDVIEDRKSTRLNSSHTVISYAGSCHPRSLHSFPTRRSSDLGSSSRSRCI